MRQVFRLYFQCPEGDDVYYAVRGGCAMHPIGEWQVSALW
jgi:hypothetical protein